MTGTTWLHLVACAGLLALASLGGLRAGRNPLALPVAVLSTALSTWNFASFARASSQEPGWGLIATAAVLMSAPPAFHFLLSFVGERRRLAMAMFCVYGCFGALAAVALTGLVSSHAATLPGTRAFILASLAPTAVVVLGGMGLLARHLGRERRVEERARTWLVLAGLAFLAALLGTEGAALLGLDVPRLGSLGTLLGLPVVAVVALRLRLFGRDLASSMALPALMLAMAGVLSYLAAFRLFAVQTAALVVSTSAITLGLLVAMRRGAIALSTQRQRRKYLATLGRFSAQMAHDLKNPIAALKGAAEYLKEEHARGHSWEDKGEFLELLLSQVERLERVVDTYQRLGRVEPLIQPVEVKALVDTVLSPQVTASHSGVTVRRELEPQLPRCLGDADLLANALENLVRNALEAMPAGGSLTVRAVAEGPEVVLSVEDTGAGMDARSRERAFDDFYTTKATGSGLGLAFVRRVAEAHRGEVSLTSRVGQGTVVRLRLPAEGAPAGPDERMEGAP